MAGFGVPKPVLIGCGVCPFPFARGASEVLLSRSRFCPRFNIEGSWVVTGDCVDVDDVPVARGVELTFDAGPGVGIECGVPMPTGVRPRAGAVLCAGAGGGLLEGVGNAFGATI